jgi:hypothetical protein
MELVDRDVVEHRVVGGRYRGGAGAGGDAQPGWQVGVGNDEVERLRRGRHAAGIEPGDGQHRPGSTDTEVPAGRPGPIRAVDVPSKVPPPDGLEHLVEDTPTCVADHASVSRGTGPSTGSGASGSGTRPVATGGGGGGSVTLRPVKSHLRLPSVSSATVTLPVPSSRPTGNPDAGSMTFMPARPRRAQPGRRVHRFQAFYHAVSGRPNHGTDNPDRGRSARSRSRPSQPGDQSPSAKVVRVDTPGRHRRQLRVN